MGHPIEEDGKTTLSLRTLGLASISQHMRFTQMAGAVSFDQSRLDRSERWQTLHTLLIINNHRRIESLQQTLEGERARLRFVEDRGSQLEETVVSLQSSLAQTNGRLEHCHKSLRVVTTLLRLVAQQVQPKRDAWPLRDLFSQRALSFVAQNATVLWLVYALKRLLWIDALIDGLVGVLRLTRMSKRGLARTRLGAKMAVLAMLFVLLRRRIQAVLHRLGTFVSFIIR